MAVPSTQEITQLLIAWSNGDQAALEELTPIIYGELRRRAKHFMAGERPGHVLQTTALINEVYLRLIDGMRVEWQNRAHFFAIAAQMMRHILVDFARSDRRVKRGGNALRVSMTEAMGNARERAADLVALDEALTALAGLHERQSRVVELRYFGGLSLEEVAEILKVSVGTVRHDWSMARAWLRRELRGENDA